METTWKQVYIFVSSTFNDMHAERDYLVKRVFPQLREWCEQRKLRLIDVDLRWGITEEAATRDRNVAQICLSRIDDCRPFFLCFLGQRRGWVPQSSDISDDTLTRFPDLQSHVGVASITELEISHALIDPLHKSAPRDPHRPPEYYEPARYAFFYLRDPGYLAQLPADPRQLRDTYTNEWIADPAERARQDAELARWRSLLAASDAAHPHVTRHYVAGWDGEESTPELMLPLQCHSMEAANVARWRKRWMDVGVTVTGLDVDDDPDVTEKARAYNRKLTAGRLGRFECDGTPLSEIIIADLQAAIADRFPDHRQIQEATELEAEFDQQEQFRLAACEGFIERKGDFVELDDYVESDSSQIFALTAGGGMGKSTLLANWAERYRARLTGEPQHSLHARFIGASDRSTTVYSLLRFLLREIQETTGKLEEEIPEDPARLREKWPLFLEAIGTRGKTVILLDALNQLETGLADLDWLPAQLPANIKLIVSFRSDEPGGAELYRRYEASGQVILARVKPFDDIQDRQRLVQVYLSQYLKELDRQHLDVLIHSPGAGNPLYLQVVLSEMRVFGAFENLATKIRTDFGDSPVSAFHGVLARLENDPAHSPFDPNKAVPMLFGLLAHARLGLSVAELTGLFLRVLELEDTKTNREAAGDTIQLFLRQVQRFLARRQGRYDFFFESFKVAAQQRYTADGSADEFTKRPARRWHRILADYFDALPLWSQQPLPSQANGAATVLRPAARKVSELPHHLLGAEEWERLESVLCDLPFIEAKCAARMTFDLLGDFEKSIDALEGQLQEQARARRDRMVAPYEFVRQEANNLEKYASVPGFTFQQAHNRASAGPVVAAWERQQDELSARNIPWINLFNRPSGADLLIATLEHHRKGATDCAFFPDGKRVVSASMDHSLVIRDTRSWRHIEQFAWLGGSVDGCDVSPDGKFIASACDDGYVRLHDVETRQIIVCEGKYEGNPRRCRFSPDGRKLTSVGRYGLKIHDAKTGKLLQTLDQELTINDCRLGPGDLVALATADGVSIYDAGRNEIIDTIYLDGEGLAAACAFSPDGHLLLATGGRYYSKGEDEPAYGESLVLRTDTWTTVEAHEHRFDKAGLCCAFLLEGKFYAVGLMSGKLHIFDSETGEKVRTIAGHSDTVRGLAKAPGGEILMTASLDNQLKAWRTSALVHEEDADEPTGRGLYCMFSDDGERAVALTGISDRYRCDFYRREYDFSSPAPKYAGALRLEWSRPGMELKLKRHDPSMPKTVVEIPAAGFGSLPLHRTAPVNGRDPYWLIHSSARISPEEFHLLPAIPSEWQSPENITWARSSDGRMYAIVQAGKLVLHAVDAFGHSAVLLEFDWDITKRDVPQCTFCQDGERLYFIVSERLYVVDIPALKISHRLVSETGPLRAFCESPSSRRILTAAEDGSLESWDLDSGNSLKRYPGHTGAVVDCAYISDTQFLSIGQDGTLRLWQAESGEQQAVFVAETSIGAFAISPSKRHVLAMDIQGHAYLLQLC